MDDGEQTGECTELEVKSPVRSLSSIALCHCRSQPGHGEECHLSGDPREPLILQIRTEWQRESHSCLLPPPRSNRGEWTGSSR